MEYGAKRQSVNKTRSGDLWSGGPELVAAHFFGGTLAPGHCRRRSESFMAVILPLATFASMLPASTVSRKPANAPIAMRSPSSGGSTGYRLARASR